MKKIRLAILISGGGSTAEAIIKACQNSVLKNINPVIVISSKIAAAGINKAKALGVPTIVVQPKLFSSPKAFGKKLLSILKENKVDLVSQNGWLPLTPKNVVEKFKGKIINQHPGPLDPATHIDFGGKGMYGSRVTSAVLAYRWLTGKNNWTECSTHFVNEKYDQGDLIRTVRMNLPKHRKAATLEELEKKPANLLDMTQKVQKKLLPIEHQNVIETLKLFTKEERVLGHKRSKRLVPPENILPLNQAKALAIKLDKENSNSHLKKILIVGSGGREHALGWKLSQSPMVGKIYFAPGNGGTRLIGKNIDIDAEDVDSLANFAKKESIDLTVVGPEVPLAKGIVDVFSKLGLKIFGPTQNAARLESNKAWANKFMKRHGIACPQFKVFSDYQEAKKFIESNPWPGIVVKASGLAAGKGVIVCNSKLEALKALKKAMIDKEFGSAGKKVVIQERVEGEEVSLIAFSDGKTVIPLLPARDHKPAFDAGHGPNTGGMGVYVPVSYVTDELVEEIKSSILQPTIEGMRKEGISFVGMLYAGLMLTNEGIRVLEFNVRFGDPETQPQMVILKSDLYPLLVSCIKQTLDKQKVVFRKGAANCVVLASGGYPTSYKKGEEIFGLNGKFNPCVQVFHAGTAAKNGKIFTNGGRVLGITSFGKNASDAFKKAYSSIGKSKIHFKNMHFRTDIGKSAQTILDRPHRIEVTSTIKDTRALVIRNKIKSLGFEQVESVLVIDVYTLDKNFDNKKLQTIGSALSDLNTQTFSINKPNDTKDYSWAIEIGFLPGVTDNVGVTTKEMIEDLLQKRFEKDEAVYSSKLFLLKGNLDEKEASKIAKAFYNSLIQSAQITNLKDFVYKKDIHVPKVKLTSSPSVCWVDLEVDEPTLAEIGKKGITNTDGTRRGPLALDLTYMKAIKAYFKNEKRNPTDIELESIAQTWSEHCKHTIFADPIDEIKDGLFKTYIKGATEKIRKKESAKSRSRSAGDFCVSVFKDNSGAIVFDENWLITDKVETHNSPSVLDPFGGAITGIGGVNRDAIGFGLGAKPIINRYGFCFANPKDKSELFKGPDFTQKMLSATRIMDGVIEGVNVGGNCSGIPTPQGFLYFDPRYRGKPLVFVGTVGLIPRKIGQKDSFQKKAMPGDLIVMIGGRVGRDGIHGATFSSESMDAASPVGAVQIGDPITQKKLSDALVKEARDQDLYNSLTDNGAGGLSCSVAEMAKECGGCEVELDKVPLKYPGLDPWQTWISESQERMTLAVPPKKWVKFKKLMDKHAVETTKIGTFTNSGKCVVFYHNQKIMDVDLVFLHNGMPARPMKTKKPKAPEAQIYYSSPKNYAQTILDLLARPNIASFSFISSQYDHEVQAGSVLKPIQGKGQVNADATVYRPVLDSQKAVVVSQGICPNYSDFDTYHMAAVAIDTAVRNAVATGANISHLALLDNFCWCSSNEPERLWQLKQAAKACHDCATTYETPFISGKDSMFNDFKGFDEKGEVKKISVPPTLLVSSLGVINDFSKVVTIDVKAEGDLIYLLGETHDELTGSEYHQMVGEKKGKLIAGLNMPKVNAWQNKKLYQVFHQCVEKDLVASSISVGRGGLAIALLKTCISGMLGAEVSLDSVAGSVSQITTLLFSESQGRILATIDPTNRSVFEKIFKNTPYTLIGQVVKKPLITIVGEHNTKVANISMDKTHNAYHQTFKDY